MDSDQTNRFDAFAKDAQEGWATLLKHITTLSTAILVFSMTFQDTLAPHPAQWPWLLGASWLLFVVSIVATTCGFWVLVHLKTGKMYAALTPDECARISAPTFMRWVARLAVPSFLLGLTALTLYAAINGPW